ncbi:MAG: CRTAC1 family protein [Aliishimia sp.]
MTRGLALILWFIAQTAAAGPVFEDVSKRLPEHIYDGGWEHFVGGGVAIFDCNADRLPDIFVAGGKNPAKMIKNEGGFEFQSVDIPRLTGVTGAYPINLDADEFTDLIVLRVGANVALKGGAGCSFTDATRAWGLPAKDSWTTGFSAWWNEAGSKPTLAFGNYVDRTDPDGPFEACDDNVILHPTPAGYSAQTLRPGFCPLSILAAKDARGRNTLRLSNDRHYYVKGGFEQMWDIMDRRMLTEADGWKKVALWGMGIASRDLTGDGRDEVMLTSMGDQLLQIAQPDGLYKAAPFTIGTYAQRPHTGGDGRPSTGWHAEFADVDNDGRADLFIAKGNVDQMPGMATRDPNNLLMQNADGTFSEASVAAGTASLERSRGAGLADFDGDGRLDIVVTNRRAHMELYRNVSEETGNWIAIELRQAGGNRDAIGAVITVTTPDTKQSLQNVIGGGHAGGQLLPRHFGLGGAKSAKARIDWPDGTQTQHEVLAGKIHRIVKP